jgi:hypothetical protein
MQNSFHLLINGALVAGANSLPVINPATGQPFAEAPRADAAQLEPRGRRPRRAARLGARGLGCAPRRAGGAGRCHRGPRRGFRPAADAGTGQAAGRSRGELAGTLAGLRWFAAQHLAPRS